MRISAQRMFRFSGLLDAVYQLKGDEDYFYDGIYGI